MDAFPGVRIYPFPYPFPWTGWGGDRKVRPPFLAQNRHLEIHDFHWFRMGHPWKMEILEFSPGGYKERVNALKTLLWLEASLKIAVEKLQYFAYFIFSKILKIELSPPRELDFGCFENCFGPFFRVPKILKIAVLRACQHSFSNVHALNLEIVFF